MRHNLGTRLILGLALALVPASAEAHFLWVHLVPSGNETEVKAFFSEQPSRDRAGLIEKVAHARFQLHGANNESRGLKLTKRVTGSEAELTAKVPGKTPRLVDAVCDYGVFDLHGDPMLLNYYAQALSPDSSSPWDQATQATSAPLVIVPRRAAGRLELTAYWRKAPLKKAEFFVTNPAGETTESVADDKGTVSIDVTRPGLYGVRVGHVEKNRSGERGGKKYTCVGHYATLTLDLASPPAARSEVSVAKKSSTESSSTPKNDAAAAQLLAKARDARAIWNDFPGFSAEITVYADNETAKGRLQVDRKGDPVLTLGKFSDTPWVRRHLTSMIQHRLPDSSLGDEAEFIDKEQHHPLGRRIRLAEETMGSEYRIQGDVVAQVNRTMGDRRFTISVVEVMRNKEGKYLPTTFTISFWDKKSGGLISSDIVRHGWTRVGNFDLPASVLDVESGPGVYKVRSIEFHGHRLGSTVPGSAQTTVR